MIRRTLLYKEHLDLRAKMVAFAGWEMPIQYQGVLDEHSAVRQDVGLFDVGHMCVLAFEKSSFNAHSFEQKWLTRTITDLDISKIRYNRILNTKGGIVDDILVYAFQDHYWWVVNASNADKVRDFLDQLQVTYLDTAYSAIALQGPNAEATLIEHADVSKLKYYQHTTVNLLGAPAIISRTGYTGEDGFEIYTVNPLDIWQQLIRDGAIPCGLGARDTLRIEAGMPLYGHELSDDITDEQSRHLLGIEMLGKAVPRENYQVFTNEKKIGYITSGTYSPTLSKPIGLAYLQGSKPGDIVEVEIRAKYYPGKVVKLPFYTRAKMGFKTN